MAKAGTAFLHVQIAFALVVVILLDSAFTDKRDVYNASDVDFETVQNKTDLNPKRNISILRLLIEPLTKGKMKTDLKVKEEIKDEAEDGDKRKLKLEISKNFHVTSSGMSKEVKFVWAVFFMTVVFSIMSIFALRSAWCTKRNTYKPMGNRY